MKNTAEVTTLFALSNLWIARRQQMGMGELRLHQRYQAEKSGEID
jgi:IS5 family transposase